MAEFSISAAAPIEYTSTTRSSPLTANERSSPRMNATTTSTGAIGYRRESHYFYVPLGLTLRVPMGKDWVLAPQIEYDGFVRGSQRSYLADTGLGFSDVTNEQMEGYGVRAQLAFEGPRWSFVVWANYWDIEDSDIQPIGGGYAGLEPANTTREAGVEARYRF